MCFDFLVATIFYFSVWYIILRSCVAFLLQWCNILSSVVCVKCTRSSRGVGSSTPSAPRELRVTAVQEFLVCGQFWLY